MQSAFRQATIEEIDRGLRLAKNSARHSRAAADLFSYLPLVSQSMRALVRYSHSSLRQPLSYATSDPLERRGACYRMPIVATRLRHECLSIACLSNLLVHQCELSITD